MRGCAALLCVIIALAVLGSCRRPIPTAPDREAITNTVSAFHEALAKGDRGAVLNLLAPDAQILESGHSETRAEYEGGHLKSDIEFAQAVPSTRGTMIVRQEGAIAWTTSTGRSTGRFQSREVNAENAELMLLAKTENGWRIRAIHWSSHSQVAGGP